ADGGRLELQSDAGDTQVTWNDTKLTVYDASSNTAYVASLPQKPASTQTSDTPPTLDQITTFLTQAGAHWAISDAAPTNVAGREAYTVTVSPKHDGGLLGSAQLAWDAPDGTKIVDLSSQHTSPNGADIPPVTGLAAVQAAAPYVVVPSSLVGLPLQDVRLVGPADDRSALAVYGEGLGAIVVVERQADASKQENGSGLDSLPTVSLDGVTAHELSTQLGTILAWSRGGVSYVLAGSVAT